MKSILRMTFSCVLLQLLLLSFANADSDFDDVQDVEYIFNKTGQTLNCSLPSDRVDWFKDGVQVEPTLKMPFLHVDGIHYLNITRRNFTATGIYECKPANETSPIKPTLKFRVIMKGTVRNFTKSRSVEEEGNVVVNCTAYGNPIPTVTWFRGNSAEKEESVSWDEVTPDDRFNFSVHNETVNRVTRVINTLVITKARAEDRRLYMCLATNDLGSSSSTVLVRVLYPLAALWPFLGICVQVVVLFFILYFSERRRNAENQHQSPDMMMNQDGINKPSKKKYVVNVKD